jgi:predicted GIY-YIG superfamily endonuclease
MFFNKKKSGYVYVVERTDKSGNKKLYTGGTSRNPYIRVGEHMKSQNSGNAKTWMGRGVKARLIGAQRSSNWRATEKTLKSYSPASKRRFAQAGAKKFNQNRWF